MISDFDIMFGSYNNILKKSNSGCVHAIVSGCSLAKTKREKSGQSKTEKSMSFDRLLAPRYRRMTSY